MLNCRQTTTGWICV